MQYYRLSATSPFRFNPIRFPPFRSPPIRSVPCLSIPLNLAHQYGAVNSRRQAICLFRITQDVRMHIVQTLVSTQKARFVLL
jgi:hypothetical protein